jgi:hypothetical protein
MNRRPTNFTTAAQETPAQITHLFLWVSHGGTVSPLQTSNEIYHTKIGRFVYYAQHGESVYPASLDLIYLNYMLKPPNNPSVSNFNMNFRDFYNGYESHENSGNSISIPPLLFSIEQDPMIHESPYHGLYYFKLEVQDDRYKLLDYDRILDYDDLIRIYGDNNITHSQIEQHVLKYCKGRNISPLSNVSIGFFSCKVIYENYAHSYLENPHDIFEQYSNPANIINFEQEQEYINFSLLKVNISDNWLFKDKWTALGKLKHQGCAMNVLSFYDLMTEPKARQLGVCLTLKGTSIFRIIDYINYHIMTFENQVLNFFVCRSRLESGLREIISFMNLNKSDKSYVIIFKMYRENNIPAKPEEFSESGHTISVAFNIQDGTTWLMDPQIEYYNQINTENVEELYQLVNSKYNYDLDDRNHFKFMDLIFVAGTISDIPFSLEPTRRIYTRDYFTTNVSSGLLVLRNRPANVPYGGSLSRKSKKTKKSKRSKRSKKTKRSKKYNPTKKIRKY